MSERLARVALSRLSEPGDLRLAALVADHGAARVYEAMSQERALTGLFTDLAARLRGIDPERELAEADAGGIRFVCPDDEEWPTKLADLDRAEPVDGRGGAPLGIWARGPLRLDEACARSAAVVGSRSATTYGAGVAGSLAADLAAADVTVISGAAFGIDQAAHRGALSGRGPTVAVLACGVDRAYPAAHRALLDYVAERGLVISEVPPGCAPTRLRFLSRNRVIAALGQGTVVVEAAVRSGALNTANWATRLNRVLMGVPGPVTSAASQGVHELVRGKGAALVTSGADVLELLAPSGSFLVTEPRGPEHPRDRLTAREKQVLEATPVIRPAGEASIARVAGLAPPDVAVLLGRLRSAGLVERVEQGWCVVRRDTAG